MMNKSLQDAKTLTDPKIVTAILKLNGVPMTKEFRDAIFSCPGEHPDMETLLKRIEHPHTKFKIIGNELFGISEVRPKWHQII